VHGSWQNLRLGSDRSGRFHLQVRKGFRFPRQKRCVPWGRVPPSCRFSWLSSQSSLGYAVFVSSFMPSLSRTLKSQLLNRGKYHVVNHHIPKCSGSSLVHAFSTKNPLGCKKFHNYATIKASQTHCPFFQNKVGVFNFRIMLTKYYMEQGFNLISGHVPYFKYNPNNCNYKRITVLREPVERFLSAFSIRLGKIESRMKINSLLEEFLDSDRAKFWGRIQCIFISGQISPNILSIDENNLVKLALNSSENFDLIGSTDNIPEFNQNLNNLLNLKIKILKDRNVNNKYRIKKSMIDCKIIRDLEDICRADIELYNKISKR